MTTAIKTNPRTGQLILPEDMREMQVFVAEHIQNPHQLYRYHIWCDVIRQVEDYDDFLEVDEEPITDEQVDEIFEMACRSDYLFGEHIDDGIRVLIDEVIKKGDKQ